MNSKINIDLKYSQANSLYLIARVKELSKKTGKDSSLIIKKMMSSDQSNLIKIFIEEFKDYINLIR